GGPGGIDHSLATNSSYSSIRSQSQSQSLSESGSGLKHIDLQWQPIPETNLGSVAGSGVDSTAPISKWADAVLSSALRGSSSDQPGGILRYVNSKFSSVPSIPLFTP